MTYDEFTEALLDKIDDRLEKGDEFMGSYRFFEDGDTSDDGKDRAFIMDTNIKYHKQESDVLIGDFLKIVSKDGKSHARFEMKYLYENFEKYGWDEVWRIIDANMKSFQNIADSNVMDSLQDYEAIRDRLILRPLNFTDNKYELKKFVYRQVGDMALVLYAILSDDQKLGLRTFKIPKEVFEQWGKDFDMVMDAALLNANIHSVPRMYNALTMRGGNPSYSDGAYMSLGSNLQLSRTSVFTTYPRTNGAISFFYPGVKERIAQMVGGDYYIAFTGISDFHVHSIKEISARDVLLNLKHMNREVNQPGEILSRKVYRYKTDTGELMMLD